MNYAPPRTAPSAQPDTSAGRGSYEREPDPKASGAEFDLHGLLRTLLRRKWLILVTACVPVILTFLLIQVMEPKYAAQALLVMNVQQPKVVNLDSVTTTVEPDAPIVGSEVDVLSAPTMIGQVVDRLGLIDDPEFNPLLKQAEGGSRWLDLPVLSEFGSRVSEFKSWIKGSLGLAARPQPGEDMVRTRVIEAVGDRLSVRNDSKTYTIKVGFTSEDPRKAALVANTFADLYVKDQLAAKSEATEQASKWLTSRLSDLFEQVRIKDQLVQEFQQRENLIETGGTTMPLRQLAELNSQLVIVRADAAQASARVQNARELIRTKGSIEGLANVQSSPLIQRLREQEVQIQRRESELANRYGPRYPDVINARLEREELGRRISEEINRIIGGLVNEADVARARQQSLEQAIHGLEQKVAQTNRAEIQLSQLRRELDATRKLYETFLERSKEVAEQQDLHRADARIVSSAEVPVTPSFPKPTLMMIIAAAVGAGFGILLALLMERLDSGFRTADQIERVSGYPVLGLMPALESVRGVPPERYVLDRPQSTFAESLRRVVAGVGNSPTSKSMKVLMVASAVPGEGKTSFSMALTRQIAASGRRVLLVEADLRRPRIGEALGSSGPSGLVDLLRQRKSLEEVIRIDNRSGAHYITAGIGEGSSQDLLASWQMKNLIRLASDQYDLVLIDTPPVMAVSDVASLGKLVDGGVMLVRWATTPRDVAINGLRQLAGYGVPILGIVLTQVDVRRYAKYSAGHYSVGGRRYNRYYSN